MKVIVRIKGGLGNQLFCYSAARRLALNNNAELIIDNVTGFTRDEEYQRVYELDNFNITSRKATPAERLVPFERYRRGVMKFLSRGKPFEKKNYLEQFGEDFDERLLTLKVKGTLYLDGLWQSEGYFKDVAPTIRDDLRIIPPIDILNQRMAEVIRNSNAVALHVRWFDLPGAAATNNISASYYQRAIAHLEARLDSPRYFLFSDDPEAARAKLALDKERVTLISHNKGDENAFADLWLMTLCRHFITANSTFSWWGAWLGGDMNKIVVYPDLEIREDKTAPWTLAGEMPSGWLSV